MRTDNVAEVAVEGLGNAGGVYSGDGVVGVVVDVLASSSHSDEDLVRPALAQMLQAGCSWWTEVAGYQAMHRAGPWLQKMHQEADRQLQVLQMMLLCITAWITALTCKCSHKDIASHLDVTYQMSFCILGVSAAQVQPQTPVSHHSLLSRISVHWHTSTGHMHRLSHRIATAWLWSKQWCNRGVHQSGLTACTGQVPAIAG